LLVDIVSFVKCVIDFSGIALRCVRTVE